MTEVAQLQTDHGQQRPAHGSTLDVSREVTGLVFGPLSERSFAITYWDSGVTESPPGDPVFTIVLEHPGALRRMFLLPSELHMAEGYVYGDCDIRGDLSAASLVAGVVRRNLTAPGALPRLIQLLLRLPSSHEHRVNAKRALGTARLALKHTEQRDAAAVRAHYDVGNHFYRLFLDRNMVYSCAYYLTGHETLEEAQVAKFDHICRKLRLQPGDKLLDIGCGWGGLIRHATSHYGVDALGITISPSQAEYARERIAHAGLDERCRVELRDYRSLDGSETFDKVVSVGMAEHVGLSRMPTYFAQAWRLLRPGGLFLNHCITKDREESRTLNKLLPWKDGDFTKKYVFPDGELVRLDVLVEAGLAAGFEARDVECLREHYARTLLEWTHRLEQHEIEAVADVGPQLYRIWRLHMGGGAAGFASGRLTIHQIVFARALADGRIPDLPLSRADLYRS